MRVAATMPGLKTAAYGWNVREPWREGDKRRRECLMRRAQDAEKACPAKRLKSAESRIGRTVQVCVRAAVRSNQAACRRKRQFLGTCSRPKVHPRAERRRLPVSRGDPDGRLKGPQDRVTRKGTHALCFPSGGCHGCCSAVRGPAGAGKRRSVPHAPFRGKTEERRPTSLEVGINTGR